MAKQVPLIGIDDANIDDAYNRVLPEAMQLTPEQVRSVNVAVEKAALVALATAKELPAFEAELRALPGFRVEQLERLSDYAVALYSAHLRCSFDSRPVERLAVLNQAATQWRNILLAEAKSLVARQHLAEASLKPLVGSHGYVNVAHDLAGLAQLFNSNWKRLRDHTGLKRAQIEEVDKLALRLTVAAAQRKHCPNQLADEKDIRARMFTLLTLSYAEIRRAIQYIRRDHDDADEIAPPLRRAPRTPPSTLSQKGYR
jgi:hypothetical protein